MSLHPADAVGADTVRVDAREKVRGTAPYAYEHPVGDPLYLWPVLAPIARGTVSAIDRDAALAVAGVETVLTHEDAPRLPDDNPELAILQDAEIPFRGRIVAGVVARTPEAARAGAAALTLTCEPAGHDTRLREDHPDLYAPESVNAGFDTDTADGDLAAGLAAADHLVDATYRTPMQLNQPLEPHTTVACWTGDGVILHESTQGVHSVRASVADLFDLDPDRVEVHAPYVGGGFGSKGELHAHAVLAIMAARHHPGRFVKLALDRRQMLTMTGHRTATIQRLRLGATRDGRLTALAHEVVEHTSRIREYAEQTAVPSRTMYAAGARLTTHRLVPLDVPVPSWMRAPGETPGMFAAECAMDELAVALELDPVELRVRNEPDVDPATGLPFSSRGLVACLRDGAERFGWADRDPRPGVRRDGRLLRGTGVASATYPVSRMSGTTARIEHLGDGRFRVAVGAVDIGTGARTVLAQIAADALAVPLDAVELRIADTDQPPASVAGGSSGTTTWGSTIVAAARRLRDDHGGDPPAGAVAVADVPDNDAEDDYAMHAFGAHFAEVTVDLDTAETRVTRMLGMFAAGRIINPRTARSQFLGGMTMGLSMALHEAAVIDHRLGGPVTQDLADYHVAAHADVPALEVGWVDEHDPHVNPMGSKGIGEIGIVGAAAAVANAVHHATGIRVRELPITPDRLLDVLDGG